MISLEAYTYWTCAPYALWIKNQNCKRDVSLEGNKFCLFKILRPYAMLLVHSLPSPKSEILVNSGVNGKIRHVKLYYCF